MPPFRPESKAGLQVEADGYRLQLRTFHEGGALKHVWHRAHPRLEAVKLGARAEDILVRERWDEREMWLESAERLVRETPGSDSAGMQAFLAPYVDYFKSQRNFEQQV
jgi:hypothetical protein